jgi:TolB-like protein
VFTPRRRWPVLAALLLNACVLVAAPPKIAVFNFTDATDSTSLGQIVPDLIEICLLASPDEVVVLERRQIDDLLREHSLSLAQATEQQALQLGRILATDYLAFGSIREEGATLVISMRLVNSKTTEIKALDEVTGEIAQLNTVLPLLIGKVLAKLQNADEATAEQLAARHRPPAGMPIERFTAAMAAAEQLDFGNALAHLRTCLSLDPEYSESRSRFVPKELPEVPSISVSDMTGDKQPNEMVSLIKKLYRNVRYTGKPDKNRDPEFLSFGPDPKGFRVYNNYRRQHLLTLPPNPISKHVDMNEYLQYENFQYDHVSGKLYSIYINNFEVSTPPRFFVSAWDMADGKMVADWEGEGILGKYYSSRPGLGYFTSKSLELCIPMVSEKAHPIEGHNKEQKLILLAALNRLHYNYAMQQRI